MTVGVVGGGITGLALTHYLRERGIDVVTFEADEEVGGVIRTRRLNGRVLEVGPQRLRLTPTVSALVDELGIREKVIEAPDDLPLYVYADGKLRRAPLSLRTFLTTDLLSWRGKLRMLAEPLTADGRPDETAAELFTRKFGSETYRNLIDPLFGGIYGSNPANMPAAHALSGLLKLEKRSGNLLKPALKRAVKSGSAPPVSFEDGVQTLPRALYEANRESIRLETPVDAIREDGDSYVFETADDEQAVDTVVVTTPADVAATLLRDVDSNSAAELDQLQYNPLALVHLRSEYDGDGFGYQIRRDEPLDTLGVSWNASLFDRDGVFTCFLGGMENPDLVDAPAETLGRIASEEFETVTGAEASVLNVERLQRGFPAYDTSWAALDRIDLPDGIRLATNYTARMGVPSRIREAKSLSESLA